MQRPRRGGELAAAFPEITEAIGRLDCPVVFDGELIVWEKSRLAFERLTQRLHLRGAAAPRAAAVWPAHYVVFDLLHVDGRTLLDRPYTERRQALEDLLRRTGLCQTLRRCARRPAMWRWPAGGWPAPRPEWRAVCSRTAPKLSAGGTLLAEVPRTRHP
ncbi:ATP-dependent DNA ligase [Streptomyces sp. NPDC002755]